MLQGERYVYKFVCSPDALFQMTSGGGGGGGGGGGLETAGPTICMFGSSEAEPCQT